MKGSASVRMATVREASAQFVSEIPPKEAGYITRMHKEDYLLTELQYLNSKARPMGREQFGDNENQAFTALWL